MDIIVHDPGRYHVSLDTVWEFEEAVHLDQQMRLVSSRDSIFVHVPNIIWRAVFRAVCAMPKSMRRSTIDARTEIFAILMGPNFRKTLPRFAGGGRKGVYLFDAWARNHEKIRLFVEACRVEHVFVSSQQAAKMLGQQFSTAKCHWLPEGITPGDYFLAFKPERDIDVLALGRRFDKYHKLIAPALEKRGKNYLYEKISGDVVFPTRLDYVEGLARTKISICVPLAISHAERAGGIETMTVRYLQSMLSRCLIVGHAPAEMVELFGYNPLIEIDYNDPAGQILGLLDRYEEYAPLIEKNYLNVRQHHTWVRRWQQIKGIMHGEATAALLAPVAIR